MIAEIGFITLLIGLISAGCALAASLWAAGRPTSGNIRLPAPGERTPWMLSARSAVFIAFGALTVSCGLLLVALVDGHFQIEYVYSTTERSSDLFLKIAALWGAQEGSLLFWSWLMAGFAAAAVWLNWRSLRRLMPYVIAITMLTVGFFLLLTTVFANPFDRLWVHEDGHIESAAIQPAGTNPVWNWVLPDGRSGFSDEEPDVPGAQTDGVGMNPLLRHPGMLIHPPMLYLGFVGLVIPFAFALASLVVGDYSSTWIGATRRWAILAWMFLSLGLILGGRWAYDVLGWGGYWAWDPVENAALLPWLTVTAFLHSINIQQKRGMFKRFNIVLVILTYWLVIFGTFATRSGIINSVHSFAESPIGMPMLGFVTLVTLGSLALLALRWRDLRSRSRMGGLLSRESLFLLNNITFVALAVIVFWGSYGAPITTELFLNETITMGPPFFQSWAAPLFGVLFVLMGLAPLAVWRVSAPERLGRALRLPTALTIVLTVGLGLGQNAAAFLVLGAVIAALLTGAYMIYTRRRPDQRDWVTVALVNVMIGAMGALALLTVAPGLVDTIQEAQNAGGDAVLQYLPVLVVSPLLPLWRLLSVGQDTAQTGAALAYGLIGFTLLVTLWEYFRGVRARVRGKGENPLMALYTLFRFHQRRYGGYFIHLGISVLAIGVIGSTLFQQQTQQTLAQGEEMALGGYTLRYEDIDTEMARDPVKLIAEVSVWVDGQQVTTLTPNREIYAKSGQSVTPPSVYHTIGGDLYVLLADWSDGFEAVTLKVYVNPMISFLWLGGILLVIGALAAMWPPPSRVHAEKPAPAASQA